MTYLNPDEKIAIHAAVTTNVHGTGAGNVVVGNDEISGFESIRNNISLNAFRIAFNGSLPRFNLQDGVIDDFQDTGGILSSTGWTAETGKYRVTTTLVNPDAITSDMTGGVITNAIDGNTGTLWDSTDGINWLNKYITLDFTTQKTLGCVAIALTTNQPVDVVFDVYGSDIIDSGYTLVGEVTALVANKGSIVSYGIDNDVAYRYYKLVCKTDITGAATDFTVFQGGENPSEVELISNASTAEEQPTNMHVVILSDTITGVLNTDLKLYCSVDDGGTWEQITLSDSGDYSETEIILSGSLTVVGTGTTIKYKLSSTRACYCVYGVAVSWDRN